MRDDAADRLIGEIARLRVALCSTISRPAASSPGRPVPPHPSRGGNDELTNAISQIWKAIGPHNEVDLLFVERWIMESEQKLKEAERRIAEIDGALQAIGKGLHSTDALVRLANLAEQRDK